MSGGVALVVAVVAATFVNLNEYAIVPGQAQNVAPLIGAPAKLTHHHQGAILLTDVDLVQVRAVDYLFYRLDHNADLVPTAVLTGQASVATYDEQGVIDMDTARQAATFAALRSLGYPVHAVPAGVIVYQLEQTSAAAGILSVGDVITALDRHPVTTLASLSKLESALHPGDPVTIVAHRIGVTRTRTVRLVTGAYHLVGSGSAATSSCLRAGRAGHVAAGSKPLACLGIYPEQLFATTALPFSLNINSEGIIGPSAGLAFALGIVEKLDTKDLTAGMKVAATGTISIDGSVGDVGGVAQKTVAVERAGAKVFFVPTPELATARAHASGGLKVYAVASLDQAVADLEHLGGAIAPSTRS
ncbi:MAG TPA: S16 family serine protease [Acidimicrobiales bacterium]|nr:S16 family serine protease [Acidimicrobiales bacterium]